MPNPNSADPKVPTSPRKPKSQWGAIYALINTLEAPVPFDELVERCVILAQSTAKNPHAIARKRLRDANGVALIILDGNLVTSIWAIMRNHRFRVTLNEDAFDEGIPARLFAHYIQSSPLGTPKAWHLTDNARHLIARAKEAEVDIFDRDTRIDANVWLTNMQAQPGDQLLCTVEDWSAGLITIELERKAQVRQKEMLARTKLLTDAVYKQLVDSREQSLTIPIEIPIALARLPDPTGYPGLNWHDAIKQDKRMKFDGLNIVHHNAPPSLFTQLEQLGVRI